MRTRQSERRMSTDLPSLKSESHGSTEFKIRQMTGNMGNFSFFEIIRHFSLNFYTMMTQDLSEIAGTEICQAISNRLVVATKRLLALFFTYLYSFDVRRHYR